MRRRNITRRLAIKSFNSSRPAGASSGGSSGGSRSFGGGGGGAPKKGGKDSLRINREIRAPEVRVIDEDGTMLGVFPPHEALRLAEGKGLDLIEIAPTAKPPTCKIMDYGKYKYENKKKEHQARKNQTVITIKEIQLRPRTDQHDLDVKLRAARGFLLEGDKVKVNLRYYGREMAHQELGLKVLERVTAALIDIAMVETAPKMEGRQLFVLYTPDPGKIKDLAKAAAAGAARATPPRESSKEGPKEVGVHDKPEITPENAPILEKAPEKA